MEKVIDVVCRKCGIDRGKLNKKGRNNLISEAKGLICYLSTKELRIGGVEIGRTLGISQSVVSKHIDKGEKIIGERGVKLG